MDDVRVPVTQPLSVEVHLEYRLDYSKFPGLREELRGLRKPQPALIFAKEEDALHACQEKIFQALDSQDWPVLSDEESEDENWQEEFYSGRHLEADMETTPSSSSEEEAPVLELLPPLSPLSDMGETNNSISWASCIPGTPDAKYMSWNDYSLQSSDEESYLQEELDSSRREKIPHRRSSIAARMLIEDLMCNEGYRNEHRCGLRFIDTDGVQHTAF